MPYVPDTTPSGGALGLGLLGNAFSSAVQGYQKQKQQNFDNSMQKGLLAAKGLDYDEDTKQFTPSANLQATQQAGLLGAQKTIDSFDADSDYSQGQREQYKGLLNTIKPGLGDKQVTDDLSANDIQPLMDKAIDVNEKLQQAQLTHQLMTQNQRFTHLASAQQGLMHDDPYKKLEGVVNEADTTKAIIDDAVTNPASANAVPIQLSRFTQGGGRLNQVEIQKMGGDRALGARLQQIITQANTGTLTKENADFAKQYVDVATQAANRSKQGIEQQYASQYATRAGIPLDQALSDITGRSARPQGLLSGAPTGVSAGTTPQSSPMPVPKIGTVVSGHIYIGGDPSNQSSWRAQ
jgi:hypothetical protein